MAPCYYSWLPGDLWLNDPPLVCARMVKRIFSIASLGCSSTAYLVVNNMYELELIKIHAHFLSHKVAKVLDEVFITVCFIVNQCNAQG